MAITNSKIRIYADEDLETLVKTIDTQGDANAIDASQLDEGETYWATVQITVTGGVTSEESNKYKFYTLPDIEFTLAPFAAGTSILFGVETSTNTVRIARSGVMYKETDQRSRENYVYSDGFHHDFNGQIDGLLPDTMYTLTPVVVDEFGRMWVNTPSSVYVKTSVVAPVVTIGSLNVSGNVASGSVNVVSDSPLTGLEIKLQPQGGGNYINATGYSVQDGVQQFYASGLSNDTTYNVYATATNDGGSATATATLTTLSVDAYVTLDDCDLDVQHKTDTIYVEVSGYAGSGATIDLVGARFFLDDSIGSTMVGDISGQLGETSITYHAGGLPSGTEIFVFAYMTYTVDGNSYTVYSESHSVTTVPVMEFVTQSVSQDSCAGDFTIKGNRVNAVTLQYKETSASNWSNATVNGNSYVISGLVPNTTYNLRGTVSNDSGSYTTNVLNFTTSPQDTGSVEINDMSAFVGEKMMFKATYKMGKYGADTTTFQVRVYDEKDKLLADFSPTVTGDAFDGVLTREAGIALPEKCQYVKYQVIVTNKGGYENSTWIDIRL